MVHQHEIYDTDMHFTIDDNTKQITPYSEQIVLGQYDHNSERFTFELPRYIDGHDMSLCNQVEVHYLNIDDLKKNKKSGVYEVDDLQVSTEDENIVLFSWLVSQNATQLAGSLQFLIRFACVTDGELDYAWNTTIFSTISIASGMYYGEAVVEEYADILQQWLNSIENELETAKENGEFDGKSAYESAVEGGYTGTETEFAESLASIAALGIYNGEAVDVE